MLIRFIVDNFLSFGKNTELNTIPTPKLRTLKEHKYNINNFDILKMISMYGSNGSGKSNLIKGLETLQDIIINNDGVGSIYNRTKFKFEDKDKAQTFIIEFYINGNTFLYGLEILKHNILSEELYISGLGKKENILIFERTLDKNQKNNFSCPSLELNEKSKLIKSMIEDNFIENDKPLLYFLATKKFEKDLIPEIKSAFEWFKNKLQIITPETKPSSLTHKIDTDKKFRAYVENIMKTFHIGIDGIHLNEKPLHEFGLDISEDELTDINEDFEKDSDAVFQMESDSSDRTIVISKKNDEIVGTELEIIHVGKNQKKAKFKTYEESDGTNRLLDFTLAFNDIVNTEKVFVVDEIERSIHPLLIKELIRKFSGDNQTKGQLLFSTHESNLLDQSIFRQDEIWFVEKDLNGNSNLYSLSDFKEHNTIDIQKGYLRGRYGSIPFLGNLKDLNWNNND